MIVKLATYKIAYIFLEFYTLVGHTWQISHVVLIFAHCRGHRQLTGWPWPQPLPSVRCSLRDPRLGKPRRVKSYLLQSVDSPHHWLVTNRWRISIFRSGTLGSCAGTPCSTVAQYSQVQGGWMDSSLWPLVSRKYRMDVTTRKAGWPRMPRVMAA